MFYGPEDFFKRRERIREIVNDFDSTQLMVYRMYIYSTPFISEYFKNCMWSFLMHDGPDVDFVLAYVKIKSHKNK